MRLVNVKERLFGLGRPAFGMWSQLCDAEGTEIAAMLGYDFVIIDLEHNFAEMETAVNHIRAADAYGCIPIIRVVDWSRRSIQYATDAGAKGILVPCIRTKEDALAVVKAARYAPLGERGTCPGIKACGRGAIPWGDYCEWANTQMLVILLIETAEAVQHIEEIASIEGIDAFLLGPYDLSFSMGLNGQVECPEVQGALETVAKTAREHGKEVFAVPSWTGQGGVAASAKSWYEKGCKAITLSSDAGSIVQSFSQIKMMLSGFYRK